MKRDAVALAGLRHHPNVVAFLRVVRVGEGTNDDDGYRRMFAGELFMSYADHPRKAVTAKLGGKPITSTAAGVGQFLSRTWDECAKALGLKDFSPASQDLAMLYLIDRRRALDDVIAGRIEQAIARCNKEWASLPGSPYGQPTKTMAQALTTYLKYGGTLFGAEVTPMPTNPIPIDPINAPQGEAMPLGTFIAAALPAIIEAVPKLGALFGSGSAVAERNIKAAEVVATIAKDAIGAKNEQELVESLKSDPAAGALVRQAVEANWFQITESGGGGIDGARKADLAMVQSDGPWWQIVRSPSFIVALLLMPLVYLLVLSMIGVLGPVMWSEEVRAQTAGFITGTIIGGLVGYYYGQTTSRNRT